jgi:hypothetical protein
MVTPALAPDAKGYAVIHLALIDDLLRLLGTDSALDNWRVIGGEPSDDLEQGF